MVLKANKIPELYYPLDCSLLLVGMMGCGKSTLGSRFAKACRMPFVDVDAEIEKAAGCSVSDLFSLYGEAEFRRGEERIMERLLNGPKSVIAAGGGSFLSERTHRPLLNAENPEERLTLLMQERRPIYEQADLSLSYKDETMPFLISSLMNLLNDYVRKNGK